MTTPESSLADELAAEADEAAASETPAPPATLEAAQALAEEVNDIVGRIQKNEARIKELAARKNAILGRELVDLMDNLKIEKFTVDGTEFKAGPYYHASIPEENQEEAHNWLEEHDAGDLINNTVVASFPKEFAEEAQKLETYIREHYQMASVDRKRAVPWARLTSWLKELFASEDVEKVIPPLELIGATVGRVVKIKPPKKTA